MFALLAGCEAPVERTVVYDPRFGEATSMDVFLPTEPGPRPALLFFHGGAWKMFSKRAFRAHARRFAGAGYVTVSANYRLLPDARFPNAVRDAACALAYLQNHADEFGIDRDRIVVMGYSAGAQLAGLIGVAPDDPAFTADCAEGPPTAPRAVISIAGSLDLTARNESAAIVDYLGGTSEEIPEVYALASPITHVSDGDPPFLLIHGANDLLVPSSVAKRMKASLESFGIEAPYLEIRGGGHIGNFVDAPAGVGLAPPYDAPVAWIAILDFLERHTRER